MKPKHLGKDRIKLKKYNLSVVPIKIYQIDELVAGIFWYHYHKNPYLF